MADDISGVEESGKPAASTGAAASSSGSGTAAAGAAPPRLDPKGIVPGYPKFEKRWVDGATWKPATKGAAGAVEIDVRVTMTNDGWTKEEVMDGGPKGTPYPDALNVYENKEQAQAFERERKRQGTPSVTNIERNGDTFQVIVTKDPVTGEVTTVINNITTGQNNVGTLPPNKSDPSNKPKQHMVKGGDGKTYIITENPDGTLTKPVDSGIPPDAKKNEVYNVPNVGLVRVDDTGKATVIYNKPADPNVKIEKDKNGRWVETKFDPATGKSTVTYIKPEGVDAATSTPMTELPKDGEISSWLWEEQKKIDARVNSGEITKEEAVAEMETRLKFATTVVAERQKQDAKRKDDLDRQSGDEKARLTAATSMANTLIPEGLKMAAKGPVGTHMQGAEGVMGLLMLAQSFANRMGGVPANPQARPTTIAPDGTITVGGPATPASPATPPAAPGAAPGAGSIPEAASTLITNLLNGGLSTLPGQTQPAAPPAPATPAPVNPPAGQPGNNPNLPVGSAQPGIPSAIMANIMAGAGGVPVPDPDGPGPLEGALDDIAANDPGFASAWEEAKRRRQAGGAVYA